MSVFSLLDLLRFDDRRECSEKSRVWRGGGGHAKLHPLSPAATGQNVS